MLVPNLKPKGVITAQVGCLSKKPKQVKNWMELLQNNFGNVKLPVLLFLKHDICH